MQRDDELLSGLRPPEGDLSAAPESRAVSVATSEPRDGEDNGTDDAWSARLAERTWRQELPRWLATLDAGRTRREYEKAVGYFFAAPGVPQELSALSLDLLLAYRGSLALRADRRAPRERQNAPAAGQPHLPPEAAPALLEGHTDTWETADTPPTAHGATLTSPLAPATVNVRLTALRQFLAHCSLWELVPQLPPERMRAALRRLKIERRRPYQVLEEQEWAAFLRAAAGTSDGWEAAAAGAPPGALTHEEPAQTSSGRPARPAAPQPWGVTRAARARQSSAPGSAPSRATAPDEADGLAAAAPGSEPAPRRQPRPPRSPAGLTGARTAQRDHALLALALATGLRAIELCSLDVDNLTREWHHGRAEWWLVLRDAQTKGQRGGRTLPLAEPLVHTLLDYLESSGRAWEHADDRATPLFLSLRAGPASPDEPGGNAHATLRARRLAPEQVRRIVDRVETQWLAARGVAASGQREEDSTTRAISPHALRHSTAIALLEGNQSSGRPPASVEHVRGWLGHFDIRTTQGYLAHLDARRHRRPFALQPETGAAPPAASDETSDTPPPDDGLDHGGG